MPTCTSTNNHIADHAEKAIARYILTRLFDTCIGVVVVNDSDEVTITDNADDAYEALATGARDTLSTLIPTENGGLSGAGYVELIWGNGYDLMADYSTGYEYLADEIEDLVDNL